MGFSSVGILFVSDISTLLPISLILVGVLLDLSVEVFFFGTGRKMRVLNGNNFFEKKIIKLV